jgi:hypothetical protein
MGFLAEGMRSAAGVMCIAIENNMSARARLVEVAYATINRTTY